MHAKIVAIEGIAIPRGHGGALRGMEILLFPTPAKLQSSYKRKAQIGV